MLLSFVRWVGAIVGFFFGFFLGAQLLEVTEVSPPSNKVIVVFLLAIACSIIGWLGAPYVTVQPGRAIAARIRDSAFGDLVGGSAGAAVGLVLGVLLTLPLSLLPGQLGEFAPLIAAVALGLLGAGAGISKHTDLANAVRDVRAGPRRVRAAEQRVLLDTSVIIDGRVADVAKAGFVTGTLLLPRFILAELQLFADSSDPSRRERGRRGLEMLSRMQREAAVRVEVIDDDPPGAIGADAKLVALGRALNVPVMTNDYGLNRVAELQGVRVLNVNDLAKAVRPVVLPGEDIAIRVTQEGKEAGQGVAYLEDGTMIVIENGARYLGSETTVTVMRVLQTVGGRMIFAQPKGEAEAPRRPRIVAR
ncbi:MAG: PIN domain nuclease [Chloroflexota bacterium]|nr:PIN domain nuclease [Chloroflexota bacterium]